MPKTVPNLPGIEPERLPLLARSSRRTASSSSPARSVTLPGEPRAVPGGIEAETRAMLDNVGRLLRAVGLDYADVVKATVYLRDFGDFAAMNTVYREYFPTEPPTRATVGVTALAVDFSVEIEVHRRPLVDDRRSRRSRRTGDRRVPTTSMTRVCAPAADQLLLKTAL